MTTTITVCETCKCAGWNAETANKTDGETLADLVQKIVANSSDNFSPPCLLNGL